MPRLLMISCAFLMLAACETDRNEALVVHGLRPVYSDNDTWQTITFEEPHSIQHLGKIAIKDGLLFVNEHLRGIHIVDNHNPAQPVPIGFINIPGNTDFDFKGDMLYADNFSDLITIRMSSPLTIEVTDRQANLYQSEIPAFPPNYSGYFECADPSKGFVVEWIEAELTNPKCRKE